MAPRNDNSGENSCNKCSKEVKVYVTCSKCKKTYHHSCVLKICGIYVGDEGKVVCCENITSKKCQCEDKDLEIQKLKEQLSELNELNFERSISQQQSEIVNEHSQEHNDEDTFSSPKETVKNRENDREVEVRYLNRVIDEKSNLMVELQDKVEVLKKYILLLEKIEQNKSPEPSINSTRKEMMTQQNQHIITAKENAAHTLKESLLKSKSDVVKKTDSCAENCTGMRFEQYASRDKTPLQNQQIPLEGTAVQTLKEPASQSESDEEFKQIRYKTRSKKASGSEHMSNGSDKLKVNEDDKSKSNETNLKREKRSGERNEKSVTGTSTGSSTFLCAQRRAWMYVGRVGEKVQESEIEQHLNEKFPDEEFSIEKLSKRDIMSNSSSFKIGASLSLVDELYKPQNWPAGVVVKRFRFFRGARKN